MKMPRGSWISYKGNVGIVIKNYDDFSDIALVDSASGETIDTLIGIKHSSIAPAAEDDIPVHRK